MLIQQYVHTAPQILHAQLHLLPNKPLLVYAGRGYTANGYHIGHYLNLQIIKRLLETGTGTLYYMVSNDQKYLETTQEQFHLEACKRLCATVRNFMNPHPVVTIINSEQVGRIYKSALFFAKRMGHKTINRLFGTSHSNLRHHFYTPIQLAPCHQYADTHNVVVLAAQDQKPFFIHVNRWLTSAGFPPVSVVYTKPLPNIHLTGKMSSRDRRRAVYLEVTAAQRWAAIRRAKSGVCQGVFQQTQDFCYTTGHLLRLPLPYEAYSQGRIGSLAFKQAYANALEQLLTYFK